MIAHVESSPYKEHIVGYQIAGGKTEEWFHFDNLGSRGPAAEKWMKAHYGDTYTEEQWCRANSEIIAETIDFFAGVVKECTQRRLAVGCFYGYTMEVTDCYSGHHAVEKLLQSRHVDFFCSPASYMCQRAAGKDWPCMSALDSIRLHGKLHLTEYDTRTHLTRPLKEARPNGCKPGTYENGLWKGPETSTVTRGILKNNTARLLTHGNGAWWFDMWGGWFAEEDIMADLRQYHDHAVQSLEDVAEEENEVAVFVDETAYSLLPRNSTIARACYYDAREALGLAGVPYAIYQMCDFEAVKDKYKACIFLAPALTKRMSRAMEECQQKKLPYMVVNEENAPLGTKELRAFYQKCGIHIWCESDEVIYAGNGWLSIHAATEGTKKLLLPAGCQVYGNDAKDIRREGDTLFVDMEQFETRLLRMEHEPQKDMVYGVGRTYPREDQLYRDAETGVVVRQLTGGVGNSNHLYFTNNSFYDKDSKLVFCSDRTGKMNLFSMDLKTYTITQLTDLQTVQKANHMLEAIVDPIKNRCYFFADRQLYAIDLETLQSKVIYEMPKGYEPHIVSCAANASYVYTAIFEDVNGKVNKAVPENTTEFFHEKFKYVSDSKIVRINSDGSGWEYIHEEPCWIAHVNVNPRNEDQITFCHEGPWDRVDNRLFGMDVAEHRIWKILPKNTKEVIGHEYWYEDGIHVGYHGSIRDSEDRIMSNITFDCTENVSTIFNFNTGHIFSFDEKLIVGDGDSEGRYIRLWRLEDGVYQQPRALCSHFSTFKTQNDHAHPRFTPDRQQVIFSSDRDGKTNIYLAQLPEYDRLPLLEQFSRL